METKVKVSVPAGTFEIPKGPLLGHDQMPFSPEQRNWDTPMLAALWYGMVVCIPCILIASAALLAGLNWIQVLLAMAVGGTIAGALLALNGSVGGRYSIPFTVQIRSTFGNRIGAYGATIFRASVAVIWFAINSWLVAIGVDSIFQVIIPGWANLLTPFSRLVIFWMAFTALQFVILSYGYRGVKFLQTWGSLLVALSVVVVLVWGRAIAGTWGPVFESGSKYAAWAPFSAWVKFGVVSVVAGMTTLVINVSDMTRAATSNKKHAIQVMIWMPLTWTIIGFFGVGLLSMAEALGQGPKWNPVEWLAFFPNTAFGILVLLLFIVGTLTTNPAANLFAMATTLANIFPKTLNFVNASRIAIFASLLAFPWLILQTGAFLNYMNRYGAVLGAIAGIMIVDFWILRRGKLPLGALYEEKGRFRFWAGGINWVAAAAFVLAAIIALMVPTYSVLLSTALGMVAYLLLVALFRRVKQIDSALKQD